MRAFNGVSNLEAQPCICSTESRPGFPLSFGVFQSYYIERNTFTDAKQIPIIGILSTSVLYLGSPIMSVIVERAPQLRTKFILFGWMLQIIALIGASFAKSVAVLILTQGFLYSLGDLIVYMPMMGLINEWFEEKRGLAYGIVDASTGVTGIGFPFVLQALLSRWGPVITLRAFAVFFFIATAPLLPLLRARLPTTLPGNFSTAHYLDLFRQPLFHLYSISNVFQGLGFFFPELFLPTYAEALGLDKYYGALLVALLSLAQAGGQLTFGYLSDGRRLPLHGLIFTSSLIAGVSTLTLWGLAKSLVPLVIYSIIYGFFASGYVVLYARMGTSLSSASKTQLASFGLFSAQKGLGDILESPLSSALWQQGILWEKYGIQEFRWIVVFTGSCMLVSALVIPMYHLKSKLIKRR